jgi:Flp pilus assembly protein protease CpaA
MKLNVWGFGLAVGSVVAVSFSICAFFVAVAPEATEEFIGYLLHSNLSGLTLAISWRSYIAGVLGAGIWTGLWAAAAARLYNFSVTT